MSRSLTIHYANPAAENLFKFSSKNIVGHRLAEIFPDDSLLSAAIRQATDALQQASHKMAEQMYKQNQTPPGGGSGPAGHGGPDVKEGEVVDGETVGV